MSSLIDFVDLQEEGADTHKDLQETEVMEFEWFVVSKTEQVTDELHLVLSGSFGELKVT